jgi:hypothetical protein
MVSEPYVTWISLLLNHFSNTFLMKSLYSSDIAWILFILMY